MHKRETELDILRVLALLAVIFTHVQCRGVKPSRNID